MVSWSGGSELVLDYAAGACTLDFRIQREFIKGIHRDLATTCKQVDIN
jgi:hypothetical protein